MDSLKQRKKKQYKRVKTPFTSDQNPAQANEKWKHRGKPLIVLIQ